MFSKKGSRTGGCNSQNRRLLYTYQKANKQLDNELSIAELARRVREHDLALKSSILCNKDRKELIRHA